MKIVLGLVGIVAFIAALGSCAMAKTVVHEIGAIVMLLIGVVAIGLAAVIEEIQQVGRELATRSGGPVPTLKETAPSDNPLKMAE
jgi:hypothetical protein